MIQQSTLDFIKAQEGEKYKMYKDCIGKPTIGVGHLIKPDEQYLYSKTLTEKDVDSLLLRDVQPCSANVYKLVKVSVNQNMHDSLCSFEFNEGVGALGQSTLLKNINLGIKGDEIVKDFCMWDKVEVNGQKVENESIKQRRIREANLFNTAI